MGWSNYLINKKEKIALEISRHDETCISISDYNDINEFIIYIMQINDDDNKVNMEVIEYFIKKIGYIGYEYLTHVYIMRNYGFSEIIHENAVPKDYKKIILSR